jgi:phosphoglycolate phosphatase
VLILLTRPGIVTDLAALNGATIAFDLDGTLVDSAPDLIGAVNAVLVAEGLNPLPYDQGRPLIARGARWVLQCGLAAAGAPDPAAGADALFDCFLAQYGAHLADESRPFPGVAGALGTLKSAGATLVVCTNKPTELSRRLLSALALAPHIDDVVGADAVSAMKPDAAHLIEAVAAVGGDLARTVMVGDADTDARAARGAGTPLILVDFGYTAIAAAALAPDVLLHHFDGLVDACARLLDPTTRPR